MLSLEQIEAVRKFAFEASFLSNYPPKMNRQQITNIAREFGFNRVKIAPAFTQVGIEYYDQFLSKGFHVLMSTDGSFSTTESDIRQLLPDAQSVIVLGLDYRHPRPPKTRLSRWSRFLLCLGARLSQGYWKAFTQFLS